MKNTGINPHDYIHTMYNGTWMVKFEHRTTKYPERNYGTGTTQYQTSHSTGMEALNALMKYCEQNSIKVASFDLADWTQYYERCDSHLMRMMEKKGKVSESEWQMAFSCDAPNKPGYYRANND